MADMQAECDDDLGQAEEEEEYEDEDDCDIDAEAEEIARRLGEELLADLSKASAQVEQNASLGRHDVIIATTRTVLNLVENDFDALSAFSAAPKFNRRTALDMLRDIVTSGKVLKPIASQLSNMLLQLSQSPDLFKDLQFPPMQPENYKRKRDPVEERHGDQDTRALKRSCVPDSDLQVTVNEAVRVIAHTLRNSPTQSLDPMLVSSISLQLHQVFLFSVTSSAIGGHNMHTLQEVSGLIQVIGVLTGISIGQVSNAGDNSYVRLAHCQRPSADHLSSPSDIGTAVYPCLVPGCAKIFSRLYNLRAHQRLHTVHRPFRCTICPASFARNHDLKRHLRLHENKGWKCGGCQKMFSRRDAIKRHQNSSKTRVCKGDPCFDAEVLEVELHVNGEESAREERMAKLWNGIASNQGNSSRSSLSLHACRGNDSEEGELRSTVIISIQENILTLHGLLQAHVGNALGAPPGLDPINSQSGGQVTLATAIARAQTQNSNTQIVPHTPTEDSTNVDLASQDGISERCHPTSTLPSLESQTNVTATPFLSMYGLSQEQAKMLEVAIASAAAAAQAQAEAEAALEEQDEVEEEGNEEVDGKDEGNSLLGP